MSDGRSVAWRRRFGELREHEIGDCGFAGIGFARGAKESHPRI